MSTDETSEGPPGLEEKKEPEPPKATADVKAEETPMTIAPPPGLTKKKVAAPIEPTTEPAAKTAEAPAAATTKVKKERLARKQCKEMKPQQKTSMTSGDYNIWYHRYAGYEFKESRRDRGTLTRCVVERDAGRTRADETAPLCIHFALGDCVRGHECPYRHTLPSDADERRAGATHDVFGRERHKTDREDMGGVGSFSRENRTLYIGGLKPEKSVREYESILRKHFGEWGDLEYIRVLPMRGIGFARYRLRTAAEFAKVAMGDQSLDEDEVLNVRWAHVDPNPIAKAVEEQAAASKFVKAAESAVAAMTPKQKAQKEALRQLEKLAADPDAYPDTDAQYAHAIPPPAGGIGPEGPPVAKRQKPEGEASAPTVAYRYSYLGPVNRVPRHAAENTDRQQPNQPTPSGRADEGLPPGATSRPQAPARESPQQPQFWQHYQPNPDTGEFHPYSYGFIYPRQAAERPQETPEERDRRIKALEQHYSQAYEGADFTQDQQAMAAAISQAPAVPLDPSRDEPGFHNDQPLT